MSNKLNRSICFTNEEWQNITTAKQLFEELNDIEVSMHSFLKKPIITQSKTILTKHKQTKLL